MSASTFRIFRRTLLLGAVFAPLLLGGAPLRAQPRPALSPEAEAVYQRWLTTNCVGDEARALATEIRRYATELAPAFLRAVTAGPPPEELRAVRAAAELRYDARAKFPLDDGQVSGVSPDAIARFRRVTRDDYVADEIRRYTLGYQSNAVSALGILGDARSRAALARIARNPRDPLAIAAREALKVPRAPT